jgi:hypothetical protein
MLLRHFSWLSNNFILFHNQSPKFEGTSRTQFQKTIQYLQMHLLLFANTIITINGSTGLDGPPRPLANVTSDLYPGQLSANFYNPVSLHLLLLHQSILISAGHPPGFALNILLGNLFSTICIRPAHLSLVDYFTLTIFGSL